MKGEITTSVQLKPELRAALGVICSIERKLLKDKMTELVEREVQKKKALIPEPYYHRLFKEEIK